MADATRNEGRKSTLVEGGKVLVILFEFDIIKNAEYGLCVVTWREYGDRVPPMGLLCPAKEIMWKHNHAKGGCDG